MTKRQQAIRQLQMQILINRMIPDGLRCDDKIAEWEAQLARLERRHLTIVDSNTD